VRAGGPRPRTVAAAVLLTARIVYAYNWYDIGGVLPLVGNQFGIHTVELGIILTSFLVGAALFQLPAGYVAMRLGSRATSIFALGGMGAFSLASAFSPNWITLAALRFGAGAGAAFFFAPALGLVTSYYPSGRRGFMIGAYNAAFSVGSGVGLFASAVLGPIVGWGFPLGVGGALLLGVFVLAALLLPASPDEVKVPLRGLWKESRPVLRSPGVWALAIGGGGLWGGYYVAAQYFVDFAHRVHPGWSLALAAAAPTVMIAVAIAGGPLGGWFGEHSRDMRRGLVAWAAASGLLLAAVPFLSLGGELAAFAVLGFANGVTFALLYLLPTYLPEVSGSRVALGLALENFVQILLGSGVGLAFAFVSTAWGASWGWGFAGIATVVFLPALIFSRNARGRRAPEAAPA